MKTNRNAPRRKGDARRPLLTRRVVRGLARLADVVPSSLTLGDDELAAALAYVTRLAAYESRDDVIAQRNAANNLTKQHRQTKKETNA